MALARFIANQLFILLVLIGAVVCGCIGQSHAGEAGKDHEGREKITVSIRQNRPEECFVGGPIPLQISVNNARTEDLGSPASLPQVIPLKFNVMATQSMRFDQIADLEVVKPFIERIDVTIPAGQSFESTLHLGKHVRFNVPGAYRVFWSSDFPAPLGQSREAKLRLTGIVELDVLAEQPGKLIAYLDHCASRWGDTTDALSRSIAIDGTLSTHSPLVIPYLVRLIDEDHAPAVFALGRFLGDPTADQAFDNVLRSPRSSRVTRAAIVAHDTFRRDIADEWLSKILASEERSVIATGVAYLRSLVRNGNAETVLRVKRLAEQSGMKDLVNHEDSVISDNAQLLLKALYPSFPLRLRQPIENYVSGNGTANDF